MANTSLDIRQSQTRTLQDQLDSAAVTQMDSVLASINNELTPPGRLIAASTPSLVVTIGSGSVVNPNTSKNRVLPFINNNPVTFTGGTITFPSTSGTITVSPGTNATIAIGASQFVAVLVQLNTAGQLNLIVGTASATLGATVIPSGSTTSLSLGYIIVQSNASSVIQSVTNAMLYQFVGGGGSGGGSGSGTGDDLDALQYQSDVSESFGNSPTASATLSTVDTTQTNATYSAANGYMTLSYDASKTVTGTGTAMTMSAAPAYTVVAGDILRVGTQARKITVVTSQTSYTIEAAFTTNPATSACTVSQAVYSKDLNNFAFNGVAISAIYTGTISDCLVIYNDTATGTIYNYTDPALIAFTAAADATATDYTTVQVREANLSLNASVTSLPSTNSNMYVRFFSNASSGSGTVNLVGYKVFFHRQSATESGGIQAQAICFTNSVGTPVGCSNPTVIGGKSQIVLSTAFPVGVNTGNPNGSIRVYLNGQKVPRFINSTLTPDASYVEINATTIQLDRDYSSFSYIIEIYQELAVVDSNTQNTTNISILQTVPTIQKFLSGSGTYTLPTSPNKPRFLKIRMVGGGGGGGAGSTGGGAGGNTTWNSTLLVAGGGAATGVGGGAVGAGGTASSTAGPVILAAFTGASGGTSQYAQGGSGGQSANGGEGGVSVFGKTIGGGGRGGSQAGFNVGSAGYSGPGGGAGAYIEAIIANPVSTYSYSVGAAGTSGNGSGSGNGNAETGNPGVIIVEEWY